MNRTQTRSKRQTAPPPAPRPIGYNSALRVAPLKEERITIYVPDDTVIYIVGVNDCSAIYSTNGIDGLHVAVSSKGGVVCYDGFPFVHYKPLEQ